MICRVELLSEVNDYQLVKNLFMLNSPLTLQRIFPAVRSRILKGSGVVLVWVLGVFSSGEAADGLWNTAPRTPEEELKTMTLPPGYHRDLVASEPIAAGELRQYVQMGRASLIAECGANPSRKSAARGRNSSQCN